MNTFTLGLRNAFRNTIRAVSIMVILGLSIGLCLVMLIAHQAVRSKITQVKDAVGNTITISPAGFNGFSDVNNALTTTNLAKVKALPHVVSLDETLTDRLTTIGSPQPTFGFGRNGDTTSNAQTSLTSPVELNSDGNGGFSAGGGGMRLFIAGGGSLPANFSLPVSILGTTNPGKINGTDASITNGKALNGSQDTSSALISTSMASKNNLQVGSTFTAYGATLTVTGMFNTGNRGVDNTVVVSLPTLERLSGQSDAVTSATATVDSLDNLSSVTTAVKSDLGTSADVQSAQDEANATVQPLQNVENISLVSLIGAIVAGGVIILMTMVMIVRERRREIGILKAIGASNLRIVLQFMSEAVTLTLAGAIIGVLIGIAGGNPVTNMLVSSSTSTVTSSTQGGVPGGPVMGTLSRGGGQFFRRALGVNAAATSLHNIQTQIGWMVLLYGFVAALVIAIIGSAVAGWLIANVQPYEVMRAE